MNITPDTSSQEDIDNLPINILNQPNIFKIASSNVSGLCETAKQNQIMTFIETHKINIMGLSETKLSSRAAEFINKNSNSYISWWNCDDKNKDGTGVGIVMDKHTAKFIQKVSGEKDYRGRLLYVDLYMKGHSKLRVIQTYIHANNIEKQQTLILYSKILEIIDQVQQNNFKIIIMGDFNINLIKFEQITKRGGAIPWKFSFISKLYNRNFLNTFSQFMINSNQHGIQVNDQAALTISGSLHLYNQNFCTQILKYQKSIEQINWYQYLFFCAQISSNGF